MAVEASGSGSGAGAQPEINKVDRQSSPIKANKRFMISFLPTCNDYETDPGGREPPRTLVIGGGLVGYSAISCLNDVDTSHLPPFFTRTGTT